MLFDCDGVLVDSDAAVVGAWTRWGADLGLDVDALLTTVHGQRSADTVAQLVPAERRIEELARIDRYEVESATTVTAIPGAVALTSSLSRWAVVTSGRTELAIVRLRAAGIPAPPVLVCADDVARGKPDPEGYLLAAHRLGVDPAEAVVLEDAPAGIAAARAAGVRAVIGIGARARAERPDGWAADLSALTRSESGLIVEE